MLTPLATVRELMESAVDSRFYESIYSQVEYLYGYKWQDPVARAPRAHETLWPMWEDVLMDSVRVGQSRRILNNAILTLARVLSNDVEPEFPQLVTHESEIRKQFWLERYRRNRSKFKVAMTGLVGHLFGVAATQFGLKTDKKTGFQYVTSRHVSALDLLWDPYAQIPQEASWVASSTLMERHVAEHRFGKQRVSDSIREQEIGTNRKSEYVRVIDYWDMGIGGSTPTHRMLLGDITGPEVFREDNPWGVIPYAFYVQYMLPKQRYPVGVVVQQMGNQEALNEIETYMRTMLRRNVPIDIWAKGAFDEDQLQQVMDGDLDLQLEYDPDTLQPGVPPAIRLSPQQIPSIVPTWHGMVERQSIADSMIPDISRGLNPQGIRSAEEISQIQAGAGINQSWTLSAVQQYQIDCVEIFFAIAAIGDYLPTRLDVDGTNYTVNDPENPSSSIREWTMEPSVTLITPQSITQGDDFTKRRERQAWLTSIAPFVGTLFDQGWYARQLLKMGGERDFRAAISPALLQSQDPVMQAMGMGGQQASNGNPGAEAATRALQGMGASIPGASTVYGMRPGG